MIKEYQAFLEAFKLGKQIKSAAQAKQYQNAANLIGKLLIWLAVISQAFGYHIPVSDEDLLKVGSALGIIYTTGNYILTMITSEKVGYGNDNKL